jgi:hypothetical protein
MAGVVTVACKLPHGLKMRLFREEDYQEPTAGGVMRISKRWVPLPDAVTVRGVATEVNAPIDPRKPPPPLIVGGYALTPGVDADFWAAWLKANAEFDAVKNKLIFAYEKHDTTEGKARENASRRSGLEPLDPTRLPRGIEPADTKAA